MFTIITGLQGDGKTLLMIQTALKLLADNPDRRVYYHDIPEVIIPGFVKFDDPKKWYELPPGAIILIDEIQLHWPPIDSKNPINDITKALTLIRKQGHDLICATQDIMQLPKRYRALSKKHIHLIRKFGHEYSTRYVWEKVEDDPDDYHAKQKAEKDQFHFPKELYGTYKSADIHINRKRLPKKLILLPIAFLFVLIMFFVAYQVLMGDREISATEIAKEVHPANIYSSVTKSGEGKQITAVQYAQKLIPRIPDIPYSAPIYDKAFKVVTFPKPQCVYNHKKNDCRCYSQQATRLNISWDMCMELIEQGWFDPSRDPDKKERERTYDYLAANREKLEGIESRERRQAGYMDKAGKTEAPAPAMRQRSQQPVGG